MNTYKAKEYLIKQGNINPAYRHLDLISKFMTDFAQQQAQEFDKWKAKNKWKLEKPYSGTYCKKVGNHYELCGHSELWQLFEKERKGK